jgi:hypothetical protein
MGSYGLEQLRLKEVASARLEENVALAVYENRGKTGKVVVLTGEVPDLTAATGFQPTVLSLGRCVSGLKDGKVTDYLVPGVYDSEVLQRFDSFKIPEDAKMVFWKGNTGDPDDKAVTSYKEGEWVIDQEMRKFDRFAIVLVGSKELVEQAEQMSGLSDEDLLAVAGGCKSNVCGAAACGADSCSGQACAAQACGFNVIPIMPIGP